MAKGYGGWVGGDDWRAIVDASVTKDNAATAVITVKCQVETEYGTTSGYSNIQGGTLCNGSGYSWSSATSITTWSTKTLKTTTYTINKTHGSQSINCKAQVKGIAGIYSGDTSTGSVNVTVGVKASYPVTYYANGGSGAPSAQTKWYGEALTLSSTKPTRTNYAFKGWATSASGGVAYASGATYTGNAALNLYAVWERTYTTPSAVSSLSATRNSDTTISATWTNNSAVPREYTALYVEVQTDAGSFAQVAKLGATATNYTWAGAQPNHRYAIRVRPYNPAGYGSYATSGYVYTTPAAPTSVVADVPSAGTVDVTVTAGALWATSHEVEVTADGGETWTSKGTVSGSGGTYSDTSAPAGTCTYRARAARASLYSAWVESNELVTLCPPLAPTITPALPSVVATGSTVTLKWVPNHPDGTAQTKAQVEVTAGGTTTTIAINDSTTTCDLTSYASTAQSVSVRVRTYGIYAEWGAWSDVVAFTAYDAPVVTVDAPAYDGEVMTALPVSVQWTATDATGISSQVLRLYDGDGVLLRSWTLAGSVSTFDLDQSTYFLVNQQSYSVTVTVTAGSTLQASATRQFDVDYVGPGEPTYDVWWGEDALACAVTVGDGDDQGGTLPTADYFYVVRVMPDGSEHLVATNLSSSEQAYDPLPPLGVEFAYRVVAVAASGTETPTLAATSYETDSWAFGFGAGVAETLLLAANPSAQEAWTHGGESYHFADGTGDGLPLWYGTDLLDVSHSWSFDIRPSEPDVAEDAQRLFRAHAVAWVRDPFGHRWRARVKAGMTTKPGPRWAVSVTADELRFEEAS